MPVMSFKRIAGTLGFAFVLGIPLGLASHSHPGITDTLWVLTPYVVLILMVAIVLPRFSDSTDDTGRMMQYLFIFVMAWAALCIGNFIGLLMPA